MARPSSSQHVASSALELGRQLPAQLWRRFGPASPDDGPPRPGSGLLVEGRNCFRATQARRAAVLVDGSAYFAALDTALRRARHSIMIVGWDFDGRIELRREGTPAPTLGALLRDLVETRPELEVRILVWSTAVIHGPSAPAELLIGEPWQDHPRIQVRLDTTHPFYAAHHQKIVCIDGAVAFVGGMDLTVDRWDTPEHSADDPGRRCPDGSAYGPVHDVMLMMDGPAAEAVCALASERWEEGTGESLSLPACAGNGHAWPEEQEPDFETVRVGLARSMPAWKARPRIDEAPRLIADILRSARRTLYIEAQYLTAHHVGEILERRLAEPDGPEIVAVVSDTTHSLLERLIMGTNRDRMLRRLRRADRNGRLRVFHPMAPGPDAGCAILVHSKLIIADDRVLRVGSSNLNNRSVGLDSELEVAVEAREEADRRAIAAIRNTLLGEHLGVGAARVASLLQETGSLIATVDRLNGGSRYLRPFKALTTAGPMEPLPGTGVLDPAEPISPSRLWTKLASWCRSQWPFAVAPSERSPRRQP